MRGISEDRLVEKLGYTDQPSYEDLLNELIDECQELQEPWMTLDEFLKSGFEGWCWIKYPHFVHISYFSNGAFQFNDVEIRLLYSLGYVTNVMPIHKPEPPR